MTQYEYGIMVARFPGHLHWGPAPLEDCHQWMAEWEADGGLPDAFFIVRRPVVDWEVLD